MVGAERFDGPAGERGAAAPDDSYWSSIDYPEPRPRPAAVPAPATPERWAPSRIWLGVVLAALLIAGAAFALGRVNGHAPVAGLHRRVDAQQQLLRSRAATIAAQGRRLASDEAELRTLRSQVSQTTATQTACSNAIAAADRAFGDESDALHALAGADFALAHTLTDRFGSELDAYAGARTTCLGSPASI